MSPGTFDVVAVTAALVAGAAGGAVLLSRALREPRATGSTIRAARVVAAGVVILATAAFLRVPLSWIGVRFFGWARVMYLSAVLALPLLALVFFTLRARRRVSATRPAMAFASLGLLAGLLGVYATYIEPNRLVIERPTFTPDPARVGSSPVRIAVLADLQTDRVGAHEQHAVTALMAERPDLILIPGDLFHGTREEFDRELPAMRSLLAQLDAPLGVYFVLGDVDTPEGARRLFEGTHIQSLNDAQVRIEAGDRTITLAGVSRRFASLDAPGAAARAARALETAPGTDDLRILLSHAPDAVLALPKDARTDLVIAGHTHGGQVQIPGFGAPITLSNVPRAVAGGGLHRVGGASVYVSRGVGMERAQSPRLRLFCVPEVTILTIGSEAAGQSLEPSGQLDHP